MSTQISRGFTIIELILFLGITGALFAALILGVNTSIAQQRYKDSVTSYKALLEQQYSEVDNPRNERDDKWVCTAENGIQSAQVGEARGTSRCVILGRYVQVKDSGARIETGDVIGIEPLDGLSLTSDIVALAAYAPQLSPVQPQTQEISWQSTLHVPQAGGVSDAGFLILRSPLSGLVRTFATNNHLPADLTDMITVQNSTASIKNCIVSNGPVGLPTQSVTMNAAVASANGIEINGNDSQC